MIALVGIGVTAVGLTALLLGTAIGPRWLTWVSKPVASTGFLIAALGFGALDSGYGTLVFVALIFCWLGDAFLIPTGRRSAFVVGLFMFLLGHLAFAAAFLSQGVKLWWMAGGMAIMAASVTAILRWLHPHVPAGLRVPVLIYIVVIGFMVAASAGFVGAGGPVPALLGAAAFTVSDIAVARNRFVAPGISNRMWGLPLYYGAVLLLASTVAP